MRSIHWRSGHRSTGWPPRSLLPSMTSSLAKHRTQGGAPIDQRFGLIGQTMFVLITSHGGRALRDHIGGNRQFRDRTPAALLRIEPGVEQHQEDPLRPAEVLDVGRGQLADPSRS